MYRIEKELLICWSPIEDFNSFTSLHRQAFILCCFCLSDTPIYVPPPPTATSSSFSHSYCQINCQTYREGGWMAHISPIEVHSMVQYIPVCALLSLSVLCSWSTPPLVADWVVIVIESPYTASESTKLSANGWSSVGRWATWRGVTVIVHQTPHSHNIYQVFCVFGIGWKMVQLFSSLFFCPMFYIIFLFFRIIGEHCG